MPLQERPPPPKTHVHLIIYNDEKNGKEFYLEIPVSVVSKLVAKPYKYLRFLGWCVLGRTGVLVDMEEKEVVLEQDNLVEGNTYIYLTAGLALEHAVDLEVINARSSYSCSSATRDSSFRSELVKRDGRCVFTASGGGVGMHIIPHARGDEWLGLIVKNRPNDDKENVEDLNTIDDLRNGCYVAEQIHAKYDSRRIVILKTPNLMMGPGDINPPNADRGVPASFEYPKDGTRFTLHWIDPDSNPEYQAIDERFIPNNVDATFLKGTQLPKPSGLLLHYNYGAAAVKLWGKNKELFTKRAGIPRPKKRPEPDSRRPPTRPSNYGKVIDKLDSHRSGGQGGGWQGGSGGGGVRDNEEWDEDDIMMLLWGNNPHAVQRCTESRKVRDDNINQWRSNIQVSDGV